MSDSRNERLAADYREMLKIQNRPYLSWIVTKGEPPYAEEYLLTVRLRTYALGAASGRYVVGTIHRCTVRVTLWDSYPGVAPNIKMLSVPPVFHPSWYSKGTYCPSEQWRKDNSLKEHILRMIATLCWEPSLMDTSAPANYKALDWYLKNRDRVDWFPCDDVVLSENSEEEAAALEKASSGFSAVIDSWPVRR